MKVAILLYNIKQGGYGGAQGPASGIWDILDELRQRGYDIHPEVLLASGNGTPNKSWISFNHPVRIVKFSEYKEALNSYDHIIMTTLGPAKCSEKNERRFYDAIMNIKVPFTMRFCGEGDWPALYPSFHTFLKLPTFHSLIATNTCVKDYYVDDKALCATLNKIYDDGRMFQSNSLFRKYHLLDNPNIEEIIDNKKSSMVSPHRWVGFKKIQELVRATPALKDMGIETFLYGHSPFYFFCEKVRETHPDCWKEMGPYTEAEVDEVLAPHKYLWNASAHWNKPAIPRFDHTVYEGLWNGCIPLLSDKMCPDWYRGEHEVLLHVGTDEDRSEDYTRQLIEWMELLEATDTKQLAWDSYKHLRKHITLDKNCDMFIKMLEL